MISVAKCRPVFAHHQPAMFTERSKPIQKRTRLSESEDIMDCGSEEDDGIVAPLPSEGDILFRFKDIEQIAVDSAISDATYHLRKARAALLRAKRSERAIAQRQMLITELL
ncbi:hypothetical protein BWQ96_06305 [Gracilariopsis chorda]|uniref:Uncharacterized protein n=1 Tax=Gracilariopsis chorda TaxID=448386 RepID=A0A2V3IPC5_9FLOR|nr:hypothetical protein BWQ96_06305 [Gracilariopsis chorda]|eukprot:PXF43936.1 hypothetical protein BWQ96_06305 [Gracilariopsis chorda]